MVSAVNTTQTFDLNHDGRVDMLDVAIVARAFGSCVGHERGDPGAVCICVQQVCSNSYSGSLQLEAKEEGRWQMEILELCQTCYDNRTCETLGTGHLFCMYLGKMVHFKRKRRVKLSLGATEDAVWGTAGKFVYSVVRVLGGCETFVVYVTSLPEGRIDTLPSASFKNRVNINGFRSEVAARIFLREFLMTEKHVPEEEIGRGLLRTKWQYTRPARGRELL